MTPIKRLLRLLQADRKDITYIYIYAIFSGLITLTLPLGIQAIIGLIGGGAVSYSWGILVGIVTLGTALTGILIIMQMTVSETLQRRIFARVSFDFAQRIPRLQSEALMKEYAPELMNRFFDTLTLQKGVPKILMDFSTAILQIIFGLILLSLYHPLFIVFGLILSLLLLLIFRFTYQPGLDSSLKESKYKYEVAYWLEELARTMTTFKLAGSNPFPLEKTDGLVYKYLDARNKHFRILLIQYGSVVTFKTLITAGLLILGGVLVVSNQINIGQFVASEIIVLLIMSSVEKLIISMETVYDVLTAIEKIGLVTDLPLEREEGISFDEVNTGKGIAVEIKNMHYQFPDSDRPTIEDLSLHIRAGEKVCIAGYNGAGKSTLIRIMAGLLHRFSGGLTYNGIPLNNLEIKSLRKHIGDHSSQEDIFKGTLIENISLGQHHIPLSDVIEAAEAVGLGDFIRKQPNGFNTVLLPEGKNLPRSIISKIILARGVVSRPQLLAIEEFFSHIEPPDRVRIADMLTSRDNPCTLIAVSDDPILASRCDRILIMQKGAIVASGTYAEILQSPHFPKVFKER